MGSCGSAILGKSPNSVEKLKAYKTAGQVQMIKKAIQTNGNFKKIIESWRDNEIEELVNLFDYMELEPGEKLFGLGIQQFTCHHNPKKNSSILQFEYRRRIVRPFYTHCWWFRNNQRERGIGRNDNSN